MEDQVRNNCIISMRDDYFLANSLTESYIQGVTKQPFVDCSIWEALEKQICKNPDSVAVVFSGSGQELTFKQLRDQASDLANGLLSMGCSKGDRILALLVEDKVSFLLFLAAAAIGAIFCQVKPRILISSAGPEAKMYRVLEDLYGDQLQGTNILTVDPHRTFKCIAEILGPFHTSPDELSKYTSDVKADDPVLILTSSGTTGQSKLIVHSQKTLLNVSVLLNNRRRHQNQDQVVAVLNPVDDDMMCWIQIVATIMTEDYQVKSVIMPTACYEPGATDNIAEQMSLHKCTHADFFPNMWHDLIVHDYLNKFQVTALLGGATGSQILTHFLEGASDCGFEFMNVFGSTEMILVSSTFYDDPEEKHKKKSIGFPFPHVEVKIVNDAGRILPINETGEILVRSPYQFLGYFNDPDMTNRVIDNDRWYHTGDMGYMESDGFLYILGRKSDQIRYKSFDGIVYPATVENAAKKHPNVAEAQCVGIPNKNFEGDDIYLCLRLKDGCQLTEEEIRKVCENQLIERDYPAYYLFMDQFPKVGARQKVAKARLRTEIVEMVERVKKNSEQNK